MTRINVGVHPRELPDRLLLAEHREITRIPNAVRTGKVKLLPSQERFTLGPGHVRFFYHRLGYLRRRYSLLFRECVRRGFQVAAKHTAFAGLDPALLGTYTPTGEDREVIIARITSKGFALLQPLP